MSADQRLTPVVSHFSLATGREVLGFCHRTRCVLWAHAAAIFHYANRRRGCVAARGTRPESGEAADHRIPWYDYAFSLDPTGCRFCAIGTGDLGF